MSNAISKSDKLIISITSTSRCNLACSYCHFYANGKQERKREDITEDLVELYSRFINYLKEHYVDSIDVRFSGGEPLILGDKLYKLSNIVYQHTGIKPYVLTNGKDLSPDVMAKAKENNISSFVVSFENPLDIDKFSISTESNISKFLTLNSSKLPIYPGVVVVKNHMFKYLPYICDYFFEKIGMIPTISELNFDYFSPPTETELTDLYVGVLEIVKKYWNRTTLKIFPYIVPAFNNLDSNEWLFEFNMSNSLGISTDFEESFKRLNKKLDISYPFLNCTKCECSEDCQRIKWLWLLSPERRESYCKMKKIIVNAFFDALKFKGEINHECK